MGAKRDRRWWATVVLAGAFVSLAMAVGGGPLARRLLRAGASSRGLDVEVTSIWPAWRGVRLVGVVVRPSHVRGVDARLEEVRLWLGPTLHLDRVQVHGALVTATGTRAQLEEQWSAWRAPSNRPAGGRGGAVLVQFEGVSARWLEGAGDVPRLEVQGVSGHRGPDGIAVASPLTRARLGGAALKLEGASAEIDAEGAFKRAHADAMLVDWDLSHPAAAREALDESAEGAHPGAPIPRVDAATPLLGIPTCALRRQPWRQSLPLCRAASRRTCTSRSTPWSGGSPREKAPQSRSGLGPRPLRTTAPA